MRLKERQRRDRRENKDKLKRVWGREVDEISEKRMGEVTTIPNQCSAEPGILKQKKEQITTTFGFLIARNKKLGENNVFFLKILPFFTSVIKKTKMKIIFASLSYSL